MKFLRMPDHEDGLRIVSTANELADSITTFHSPREIIHLILWLIAHIFAIRGKQKLILTLKAPKHKPELSQTRPPTAEVQL